MTPIQKLLLAELAFAIIIIILVNVTRKPSPKKSHRERLSGSDTKTIGVVEITPDAIFNKNKAKYLEKIKSGAYKTQELICRGQYDVDQEFYKCLEEVYFS